MTGDSGPAGRSRSEPTAAGGSREQVDGRAEPASEPISDRQEARRSAGAPDDADRDATAGGAGRGRSGPRADTRPATPDASGFASGPSRVGWGLTAGFGLLAALPVAVTGPPGLLAGAGLVGLLAGLARESDGLVGLGGAALLGGVLAAGVYGLGPEAALAATAGALLAYDAADNALSVGAQLGPAAPTADLELVHAAAATVLLATGGAVAYAVFRLVGGGQPELALLLLVVGAVALSAALR